MNKIWVGVIAGAVGFGLGVLVTRNAIASGWQSTISNTLGKVGLAGGSVEKAVDAVIIPQVS